MQWSHSPLEDATWENLLEFSRLYKIPDLDDKVIFGGEGSDSWAGLNLESGPILKQLQEWLKDGTKGEGPSIQTTEKEGRYGGVVCEKKKAKGEDSKEIEGRLPKAGSRKKPSWLDGYELSGIR